MDELQLGRDLGQRFEPGACAGAGVGKAERIESGGNHRRKPAVAAHRIDEVEDDQRLTLGQLIENAEIRKRQDFRGVAARAQRACNGFRGQDRVDLVGAVGSGRMQDGDEPACPGRRHADLRNSLAGRVSP